MKITIPTMITILSVFIMAITGFSENNRINRGDCTYKGIKLFGRVKIVNSFPDIKVKVVSSFADLKVQTVTSFPDRCGKWQFVTNFPDFTIQYVESFPELKIKQVNSFPGME